MRTIVVNESKGLTVEIGADSLSYEELKETVEKLMQPTLQKVVIPNDLFLRVYPKMITAQEVFDNFIIQPERLEAKLPITDNLALSDKLRDIICQKSIVDVDTEDLPKERYHDRTFPKNYYKKKKKKRRMQKQSRRQKYL